MRILITSGGTAEPVDGVRRLTNISTGATGAVLARVFADKGAEVLHLHAVGARSVGTDVETDTFVTFADLELALRRHLRDRDWDAIIHLAAVSDYSVASIEVDGHLIAHGDRGKIGSGRDVVIRLTPNPKLIDKLKSWSRNKAVVVVGFKLTNTLDQADRRSSIRTLLDRGATDLVVHNDMGDIDGDKHPAEIWTVEGPVLRTETKADLAIALYDLLQEDHNSNAEDLPENHR